MDFVNLFQLLEIHDPSEWTLNGVESAWHRLQIAARNRDSSIHKTRQDAVQYLRDDSPDARKLVEELTGATFEFSEPANIILHCLLIVAAKTGEPFTLRSVDIAVALVRHGRFGGFTVFRHEHDPYTYAVTEGFSPGEEFVPEDQSGPPLKNGEPRFGEHSPLDVFIFGPITFLEHLREFFVDLLLFRWLRSTRVLRLAGKVGILAFISWWLWQAAETYIARTDVWEDRWISDEIMSGTDNAEEVLRVVRTRFQDVVQQGETAFGWENWWEVAPTPEVAYQINVGDSQKRELYKQIRTRTADLDRRIMKLTPELDRVASAARSTQSRDGVYRANRIWDEATSIMKDLKKVHSELENYQSL